MAKKKGAKVNATQEPRAAKPVRLDLPMAEHEQLEEEARKLGLSMASFARMVIIERLRALRGDVKR